MRLSINGDTQIPSFLCFVSFWKSQIIQTSRLFPSQKSIKIIQFHRDFPWNKPSSYWMIRGYPPETSGKPPDSCFVIPPKGIPNWKWSHRVYVIHIYIHTHIQIHIDTYYNIYIYICTYIYIYHCQSARYPTKNIKKWQLLSWLVSRSSHTKRRFRMSLYPSSWLT